jgi:hypothetical protein
MRSSQHNAYIVLDRYDVLYTREETDAGVGSGRRRRLLDSYGFRFYNIVVKCVRNITARFRCVFGSTDGPLNVRRILRIWLCAYLLSS